MKTFTLDEAQALLPVVESLLTRAIEARDEAGKVESELQELNRRIHLSGGIRVDVSEVVRQRAQVEAHSSRMRETLEEIDEIGVQIKDLEAGRAGDRVLALIGRRLCRKAGNRRAVQEKDELE